ncbi:hypothetical protein [Halorientalis marina]|jgi:hypothetical protein|uniref:hypothetical protein n=1 Tax=Halorientalis marina TaxID=2931976 RepID=UPI001FF6F902|nr:hypothetical protein [Halorientalis marina]
MRDVVTFRSGPDGSLILAPDPGEDYDYEDMEVELSGRTIHVSTPEGGQKVRLEVVHGESE